MLSHPRNRLWQACRNCRAENKLLQFSTFMLVLCKCWSTEHGYILWESHFFYLKTTYTPFSWFRLWMQPAGKKFWIFQWSRQFITVGQVKIRINFINLWCLSIQGSLRTHWNPCTCRRRAGREQEKSRSRVRKSREKQGKSRGEQEKSRGEQGRAGGRAEKSRGRAGG